MSCVLDSIVEREYGEISRAAGVQVGGLVTNEVDL